MVEVAEPLGIRNAQVAHLQQGRDAEEVALAVAIDRDQRDAVQRGRAALRELP